MPGWADHAAVMDVAVDDRLGDTISYSRNGAPFADVPGFVILAGTVSELGGGQFDPIREVDRVKLRASLFGKPDLGDRLTHPLLGAFVFKPQNIESSQQGRYWIFELGKVSAL